jgi:predicted DNA-binding ribbon-helix-helix protein
MKSSVAKRSKSTVIKRSVVLVGHKTSISLEDEFWKGFKQIAAGRGETVSNLIAAVDADRQNANLSSAIRLFVLGFYREQVSDHQGRVPIIPAERQTLRRS